jgi:PIN domain nuclease of toxin-antitoxin system
MILLLDTHLLLWAAGLPDKLSTQAREMIENPEHRLWFSVGSLWEVTIKSGLNRPDFRVDSRLLRRGLVENGYEELPISSQHVLAVAHLPDIHKDPFDRLLVAQAECEGALLLTMDDVVARYPGPVHRV